MFAMAGQTAEPNGLNEETHGYPAGEHID